MRAAILANCNGASLAACIQAMNPGFDAQFTLVDSSWVTDDGTLAAIVEANDVVFVQDYVKPLLPPQSLSKVHLFPRVAFSGFHPDMTYARGRTQAGVLEPIDCMMSTYHSAIAVFGYIHRISIDQIVTFFNPYVYSRLGYFDAWAAGRAALLDEGRLAGIRLDAMFERWARLGCFMYSFNHPRLFVMEDIARALLEKINITVVRHNVSCYIDDALRSMPVWPIYPEIAARLNLRGDFGFKPSDPHVVMSLHEFVSKSYDAYSKYSPDTIEPLNISIDFMRQRLGFSQVANVQRNEQATTVRKVRAENPYSDLPAFQFWKRSVASVAIKDLDPVVHPKFSLSKDNKIATAGSCFAQHIARTLCRSGFDHFVTEIAPAGLDAKRAFELNYGIYSARYGNIYTVRQLAQLIDRIAGRFRPEDVAWKRPDGRVVDPFRPQINPEGFADEEEVKASMVEHFVAVRQMFKEMDVFVFTLGLTEGWRSRHDGAVFPLAPGVVAGEVDFDRYEFKNFSVIEIIEDLDKVVASLADINPNCKILLTVSPVPLIATYESQHALTATTYSKSVLRTAAEHASRTHDNVSYFPSYEIITGVYSKGKYFEDDLRSVNDLGVSHVMRVFMRHYTNTTAEVLDTLNVRHSEDFVNEKKRATSLFAIVCDEQAIEKNS